MISFRDNILKHHAALEDNDNTVNITYSILSICELTDWLT